MKPSQIPYFELHIQPLFRLGDRDQLDGICDPSDYKQAAANQRLLMRYVAGEMRGHQPVTGSWPSAWIDQLSAWYQHGCQRLQLGTAIYRAERRGQTIRVIAEGHWPGAEDSGFLDREHDQDPPKFTIYWQPGPLTNTGRPFQLMSQFKAPAHVRSIYISDRNGCHDVAIANLDDATNKDAYTVAHSFQPQAEIH